MRVCLVAALIFAAAQARPDDSIARMSAWVEAVERHEPGTADAPATSIGAWPQSELRELTADLYIFVERLDQVHHSKSRHRETAEPVRRRPPNVVNAIRGLAGDVLLRGDSNQFLKRAALLHADIAMLVPPEPSVPQPPRPFAAQRSTRDNLSGERLVIQTEDGVVLNIESETLHWQIGRMVLDSVSPDPARDKTVRQWYRATIAHQQRNEEIAYARPQLAAALHIFGDDAYLLFYAGALHETSASARVQAAVRDLARRPSIRTEVASAGTELKLSEEFFRRSLEADPQLAEARLRLGRVLGLQGRHEEAATELRRALPRLGDSQLGYYGELFLGQEEAELGRRDAARERFERAAELYPHAQSPRLALSLLARRHGDGPSALRAIKEIYALSAAEEEREDPWWQYHKAHVRDAEALLVELRRPFLAEGKQ